MALHASSPSDRDHRRFCIPPQRRSPSLYPFLDFINMSESEDEDEVISDAAMVCVGEAMTKRQRCTPIERERLNWDSHASLLNREGHFTRMYCMSYASYLKLLTLLSPALEVDANQGNRRSQGRGHITPQLILHCLI